VINDAHSACLAEYESFYKKDIKHMIMLTLGTGVGGAVIINGHIFQGRIQRAGHLGHITVDHMGATTMTNMVGSLEYAIGNFSVQERTYNKFKTTKDLVTAYQEKDPLATYWWLSSIQKLATGIGSLINALSPELIVIGGGIAEAEDDLFNPLDEFMSLYEWRPNNHQTKIVKAKYGNYAGAIGAAFFAKQKNN
jgi:glucokinase